MKTVFNTLKRNSNSLHTKYCRFVAAERRYQPGTAASPARGSQGAAPHSPERLVGLTTGTGWEAFERYKCMEMFSFGVLFGHGWSYFDLIELIWLAVCALGAQSIYSCL